MGRFSHLVWLLTLFAKNERANLSDEEVNVLARRVATFKESQEEGEGVMSKAFDEIQEALQEAIAHTRGEDTGVKVRQVVRVDVASIRARLGMSQAQFAEVFGFSRGTLQGWEQHRREPDGPAKVLLRVTPPEPRIRSPTSGLSARKSMSASCSS